MQYSYCMNTARLLVELKVTIERQNEVMRKQTETIDQLQSRVEDLQFEMSDLCDIGRGE